MAGAGAATDHGMASRLHAVFIDTNLETHLAMVVSDSDTVSDLKAKINLEHSVCFPQFGEIKVDAVKVKCRGHSYHLSDSMLVASALGGVKKNWFLLVDISRRVEHPEGSGVLRPLLALTDIVNNVADNQQKQLPGPVITSTPDSPYKVSRGLELMVERNRKILRGKETSQHALAASTVGEYSETMNEEKLSDVNPAGTNLNAKKRKRRTRASSSHNSMDDAPAFLKKHIHEDSVHVDNDENGRKPDKVVEPSQSFDGALSSKAHDTSVAENPDNPLKLADVEMNDVDAGKENNEIAAEFTDENGVVSVVMSEANNQGKGNNVPAVDSSADVSKIDESHRNEVSQASAPNELLAEHHINASQDKLESGSEEVTDACKSLDTEKKLEDKFSPKKRKKSSKLKSITGERSIMSTSENPEVPLGVNSLVETLKSPNGDDSDKPENEEHNFSRPQVEGTEVAVEDANIKSHGEQGNEMGSLQQITEKAATANNTEEKNRNRNRKRRSTEEKNGRESGERIDGGESNVSNADEKERAATAAVSKSVEGIEVAVEDATIKSHEEQGNEMGSLQQITEKAAPADNIEEKKRNRNRKRRSTEEKNGHESRERIDGGESNVSNPDEKERTVTAAVSKSEEHRNETMSLELREQGAVNADNDKEKPKRRTRKRSSKEKNVQHADDGPEKGERNSSHVEGNEMVVKAVEKNSSEENVDETKKQHREDIDDIKEKRARKHREKHASQLSNNLEKEEINHSQTEGKETVEIAGTADDESHQEQVDLIETLLSLHETAELKADSYQVDIDKKSRKRRGTKENTSGQSMHMPEKEEVHCSQAEVQERVTTSADKGSLLEQGNEMKSLEHATEKQAGADNHEEKMEKKSRHRKSSKEKNFSSQEMIGLNSSHNVNMPMEKEVGENGEKVEKTRKRRSKEKNAPSQEGTRDSGHKEKVPIEQEIGDGVEEKIEKKARRRRSSKEKIVPGQEMKGVESSHNNDLPTENVDRADEANDHMVVELRGSEKINFGDYFSPRQAQPDFAASGNDSVDEGKKKKSQVGKRSTNDPDKLTSHPDKELAEITGNGSEAAALTNSDKVNGIFGGVGSSKVLERTGALGNRIEVSASSTSSLNRLKNTTKAGKSRSTRDQFHVAIRKPTTDGSEHKRSLLSIPGAIFKEDSSCSSEHAAETDNSYSSMRTPSKKLSDYLGSGSDADEDTTDDENFSQGVGGQISNAKSGLSGAKSLTLDKILRNSSRYKKVKQAAVESQLNDSESQPVEYVPDSQANH